MRKIWILCLYLVVLSCDDGDLQIETLDFSSSNIQSCDSPIDIGETTLFFKIQGDEALILNLENNLFSNASTGEELPTSSISNESQLTYRFFSGDVSTAYFCDEIPPVEPTVLDEIEAEAGTITIISKVSSINTTTKTYSHNINITDLTLINSLNERLTDNSLLDYGNFTTTIGNSATLAFKNYADIPITKCEENPLENTVRLYKTINDEFIFIDLPTSLFVNEATSEPRVLDLATAGIFKNLIVNGISAIETICASDNTSNQAIIGEFFSTEGTISVATTASEPNTEGMVTYTHTITLLNVKLSLKATEEGSTDTVLSEIESIIFGEYTTTST
ncbi:hypothetical protein [Costertonia aggregata]|uniref:Uncharacterized protein n=1 Tax=Costertonia aggregata TaxID=343403 RepID=A0A7H9ASH6_9FLAO|nr:hypothetical protein [Costertonia aggregata]QLG46386.1 hypothetical protein HYG79_13850 [Costertonia aggregata]